MVPRCCVPYFLHKLPTILLITSPGPLISGGEYFLGV